MKSFPPDHIVPDGRTTTPNRNRKAWISQGGVGRDLASASENR